MVSIGYIFKQYSLYKKSDIQRLIENRDEVICGSLFNYDPSYYFTVNELTRQNYIFEYEYLDGNLQHKLRLETNGSVYFDEKLLYVDQDKVIEFLIRYSKTSVFTTSHHAIFYRNYLVNREIGIRGLGTLPNPTFRITFRTEKYIVFRERLFMTLQFADLPETKAMIEMWQELARFGKDGAEILPTMLM